MTLPSQSPPLALTEAESRMREFNKAFTRGIRDFRNGLSLDDNPYTGSHWLKSEWWKQGYFSAAGCGGNGEAW